MTRDRIVVDLDKQSVEIATGYGGVGVFMTIIGARGNRIITVALPRGKADEVARLLRMAAQASRFAQERREFKQQELGRISDLQGATIQRTEDRT